MKFDFLSKLNDSDLLTKRKKMRINKYIDALLVGFTFGITIYSIVKNGFSFFTFFPLIL